jgi:hypothetical protein
LRIQSFSYKHSFLKHWWSEITKILLNFNERSAKSCADQTQKSNLFSQCPRDYNSTDITFSMSNSIMIKCLYKNSNTFFDNTFGIFTGLENCKLAPCNFVFVNFTFNKALIFIVFLFVICNGHWPHEIIHFYNSLYFTLSSSLSGTET